MGIKIATVCSGIGSPEQALKELDIDHEISFACEIDKYARQTYLANFTPNEMYTDLTAEEWDKPEQYSDLFIGGIPCQAFSLAGKRLGELDKRGLLFYDFYRYVKNQQPKVFIIENVKGLLSDNNGITFQNWCALLGRSMNTHINMFNHDDSLLYNLHFKVLNSKDFGVPQNRERVFLIGIRNDLPNTFRFPIGERLKIRLKDILESEVDEKYYLSEKMIAGFVNHAEKHQAKGNGFKFEPNDISGIAKTIVTGEGSRGYCNFIQEGFINQDTQASAVFSKDGVSPTVCAGTHGYAMGYIQEPYCVAMRGREPQALTPKRTEFGKQVRKDYEAGTLKTERKNIQQLEPRTDGVCNTITSVQKDNLIVVKEATKQGYAIAKEGDSINLSNPNSETRRGRVGNQIANTLDTACNQGVVVTEFEIADYRSDEGLRIRANGLAPCINSSIRETEWNPNIGTRNALITSNGQRIRRLTPLECMRLQGYPDSFIKPCSDSQTYKQAGNSITVNVMKAIIENILPILS
jgi:DNA (cytosine-5)-methyltransferase 1